MCINILMFNRSAIPSVHLNVGAFLAALLPTPAGTGTVLVEVQDVNDVPPKFMQPEWSLEVPESPDAAPLLAALTVLDPDDTNTFAFRVSQRQHLI